MDGRRDDTPTNVLEDSGVDLGDTYTRSIHVGDSYTRNTHRYHQKHHKGPLDKHPPPSYTRIHRDTQERNNDRNNVNTFRTFGKNFGPIEKQDYRRDNNNSADSLSLSPRRKNKDCNVESMRKLSKSSDSLVKGGSLISSKCNSEAVEKVLAMYQAKSDKCRLDNPAKNVSTGCQFGKSVDKSTHTNQTEIGGVCFCAVEPRKKRTNLDKPNLCTTQDVVRSKSSSNCKPGEKNAENQQTEPKWGKKQDYQTAEDFEEIFIDTPVATPIIVDKTEDLDIAHVTQSCQTDKSVFHRKKKDTNKSSQRTQEQSSSQGKSNLLRSDLLVLQNPHKNGSRSKTTEWGLGAESDIVDECANTHDFVREGSIRSLMSITDTMSVTSMEVANIMAVTEDSQKSAVALEKERLRLQHQRLESYQEHMNEEQTHSQESLDPQDVFDKFYNDESLRKQKIVKSVLENIPIKSPVAKTSGKSIHTFVAQSLQSFFDESKNSKDIKSLGSSNTGAFKRNQRVDEQTSPSEDTNKRGMVSPSLYQLTTAFRLFHVSYGDPADLHKMRLITCEVKLDQRSAPASPGSGGVKSGERTCNRVSGKAALPGVRYVFLVIAELRNYRMEMDEGGIQPGDHIIEVSSSLTLQISFLLPSLWSMIYLR